jgi:hypothetical protein
VVSSRGELEKLAVKELRLLLGEEDYDNDDDNDGGGEGGGIVEAETEGGHS